jgi:prenyltransferase beta subunit
MTIRMEMLTAAARAKNLLGSSARNVLDFTLGQFNPDGGFKSRGEQSDLYYTVFGIEILKSLDAEIPYELISNYLGGFKIEELDLVHLSSLIRCYANLSDFTGKGIIDGLQQSTIWQMQKYLADDGGYNTISNTQDCNLYGCFLAMGIYQEIGLPSTDKEKLIDRILSFQQEDGGFANEKTSQLSMTPATAAAVVALKHLGQNPNQSTLDWLLSCCHPQGGFCVIPVTEEVFVADLLSTATTLHALAVNDVPLDNIKEKCLDYLDSLWSLQGGFVGSKLDDSLDCEYTYYGLLSLGHLNI